MSSWQEAVAFFIKGKRDRAIHLNYESMKWVESWREVPHLDEKKIKREHGKERMSFSLKVGVFQEGDCVQARKASLEEKEENVRGK